MANRKRLIVISISLFTLLSLPVKAQQNKKVEIKGTLVEKSTQEAIEAVTIRLLSVRDSTMKAGVASGIDGQFSLKNIAPGDYLLHISYIDYGGGANTTLYLPYEFKIESDITYSANSGYSDGYEQEEWLWNASCSKSFLKGNAATLRFKIYDILQQRSNISYSATSGYTRYSEFNTLNSYFMFHFIYKFSIFKGGASMSDMRERGRRQG